MSYTMGISLPTSCIIFPSIILVLVLPLGFTCGIAYFGIHISISCILDVSGNKTFDGGFSITCVRGLLIRSFILCLYPALP